LFAKRCSITSWILSGQREPIRACLLARASRHAGASSGGAGNRVYRWARFCHPDDVKSVAQPVLEHRLVLRPELEIEGLSVPEVINEVLESVAVPR